MTDHDPAQTPPHLPTVCRPGSRCRPDGKPTTHRPIKEPVPPMHRDYLTRLAREAGYSTDWNLYTVAAVQEPALISAWLRAAALIARARAEQDLYRDVVAWLFDMAEDQRRCKDHEPLVDTAADILTWTHRLREADAAERGARSAFAHHSTRLAADEDFLGPITPIGDDHDVQPAG